MDDAIINPIKGKNDPDLPDRIIFSPTLQIAGMLLRLSKWKVTRFKRFDITLLAILKDRKGELALVGSGVGAPMACAILEKVIACGGRKVVMVSCCGSLGNGLKVGDFFIPVSGISEEGTSRHYINGNNIPPPDEKIVELLERENFAEGLHVKKGSIWTTDAPYRETRDKVRKFKEDGLMAVDMEFTALCSVAAFRKISFASLMVVSDELHEYKWNPGFSSKEFKSNLKTGCRIVLDAMESLIYEDSEKVSF